MRKMRPERDLLRPHGCGDKLRGDDERVAALPVADEIGERCERGSPLAGTERRYQERGVARIEERRSSLLVSVQDASGERCVHDAPPFKSVALLLEYLLQTCSSL